MLPVVLSQDIPNFKFRIEQVVQLPSGQISFSDFNSLNYIFNFAQRNFSNKRNEVRIIQHSQSKKSGEPPYITALKQIIHPKVLPLDQYINRFFSDGYYKLRGEKPAAEIPFVIIPVGK